MPPKVNLKSAAKKGNTNAAKVEREAAAAPNDAAAGIAPTLTRRGQNRQGELVLSMLVNQL
jgi:hypothetical protein